MSRIIFRSIVLTFAILGAIIIAKNLPEYLEKAARTNDNLGIAISIGVLILTIIVVVLGNWVAHKIKTSHTKKK